MKSPTIRAKLLFAAATFGLVMLSCDALAWSQDMDKLQDSNTLCKLEPEAQCTQAIRIGLQAPGADLHESSMAQMRLDGANLQGANLSGSIMQLVNLHGANLMLSNLERVHLHAANLQGANLMLANLRKANLLDADLSGANLRGANLEGAILIKAKFDGAIWTDGRVCAHGSVGDCL
jgi:uncharacterized protein YjbI with pentapeptide repeats